MEPHAKLIELLSNLPGMQDFRSGVNLCSGLFQCEDVPGDVVEFGCWNGYTAALFTALTDKQVWVYDSFQGLPAKTEKDITREDFVPGYLATPQQNLVDYFYRNGLRMPRIIPKWFKDVKPWELPERIAFAHIDGDFYSSTLDALKEVYPRLSPGAWCVIHDYGTEILQGVKPAVEDFLHTLIRTEGFTHRDWPATTWVLSPNQFCIVR